MIIFFDPNMDERLYSKSFAKIIGSQSAAALLLYAVGYEKACQMKKKTTAGRNATIKIPCEFAVKETGLNEEEKAAAFDFLSEIKLIKFEDLFFSIRHDNLNKLTSKLHVKVLDSEKKRLEQQNIAAEEHEELLELRKEVEKLKGC